MPFKLVANISRFFPELGFLERFEAAKKAGFAAVEFTTPLADIGFTPEQLAEAKSKAGIDVALINGCSGLSFIKSFVGWDLIRVLYYTAP